ncbi:MAG TPA: ABC transporter substrate-binding protein [Acidimicrobiia bacterium]|nr:ABC transporter substrate-binding protein [Acidimicrobiia bacterium]
MKRSLLLLAVLLALVACSPVGDGGGATTTSGADEVTATETPDTTTTTETAPTTTFGESDGFPVTVTDDLGEVTIDALPDAIVSLSSTATEMLFAIGGGDQVVAVDDRSNYPAEAPVTDLSAFTPNVEAILAYEPDLVVISYDPGDLIAALNAANVPVLTFGPAFTLDDTYRQIGGLGTATGHADDAVIVNERIQAELDEIMAAAPDPPQGTDYYHEVDNTLFSATSSTFIGQIYTMFGLVSIADEADADGSAFGFPQLSSEYIVEADPDLIFLANAFYGESAETVAARPGWEVLSAVQDGYVVELDSDVASRWGPRVVDFAQSVSDALLAYVNEG